MFVYLRPAPERPAPLLIEPPPLERPPLKPPIEEEPKELLLDVDELRNCDERFTLFIEEELFTVEDERIVDVPSLETRVRELLFTPELRNVELLLDPLTTALLEARRPAPDSYAAARRSEPALRPLLKEVTEERSDALRRFVIPLALLRV